jgi:hypothetical protein
MAGNCTIDVTQDYVNALVTLIKRCHARLTKLYLDRLVSGIKFDDDESLNTLDYLESIIIYLEEWNDEDYDCKDVHCAKERAISFCKFTEQDILDLSIVNALVQEDGISLYFSEDLLNYLQVEEGNL